MSENLGDVRKTSVNTGNQNEIKFYGLPAREMWTIVLVAAIAVVSSVANWLELARFERKHADVLAAAERRYVDAQRQYVNEMKQIQVQMMYSNALYIREGLVKPGDMVFGPEGNLEYDGKRFMPVVAKEK